MFIIPFPEAEDNGFPPRPPRSPRPPRPPRPPMPPPILNKAQLNPHLHDRFYNQNQKGSGRW